ncbi:MAG TPA: hypothetical protein VN493_07930 [Thermoanaerobaculia bacterium]|nr:hypothetical protein [Thermoanaerobaculia bacterium]
MLKDTRERNDIAAYQSFLGRLYGEVNKDLSWEYIFGYLCRSVGYLCKNIADNKPSEKDMLRALSWLLAFSNQVKGDAQKSLIDKYPGLCPYCIEQTCVCFRTGKQPSRYTPAYEVKEKLEGYRNHQRTQQNKPLNLDLAVDIISKIYPNNEVIWRYAGPWHLFAKLQEETAELHEAMAGFVRKIKPFDVVSQEMADVFAWLLASWGILFREKSLDGEFISYYLDGCPVCRRNPCKCQPYNSRPEGLIDVVTLKEIKHHLEELTKLLPESQALLGDAIQSVTVAAETQDEAIARLSVSQTTDKLEEFKKKITTADEIGKKSFSLVNTILSLADKFM